MPPAGHFSDPANEVVCPLKNNDGSSCRKKCTGVGQSHVSIPTIDIAQEKKYRSMQEHIRRAHPEHYIPKLPATEESFALMVNSAPHERPPQATTHPLTASIPAGPVGKSSQTLCCVAKAMKPPRPSTRRYTATSTPFRQSQEPLASSEELPRIRRPMRPIPCRRCSMREPSCPGNRTM